MVGPFEVVSDFLVHDLLAHLGEAFNLIRVFSYPPSGSSQGDFLCAPADINFETDGWPVMYSRRGIIAYDRLQGHDCLFVNVSFPRLGEAFALIRILRSPIQAILLEIGGQTSVLRRMVGLEIKVVGA